jgi:hypothetical protein
MTTTEIIRDNLLLKGLGRPVALNAIDWKVKQENPSASDSQVQQETLDTIRSLVDDGLFRLGEVEKFRFVASKRSLDRSMRTISHQYVGHYDEPKRWMYSAWMKLTDKGQQLAQCLEERAIDSHREHEVGHEFSCHDLAELKQLPVQVTPSHSMLHRSVA